MWCPELSQYTIEQRAANLRENWEGKQVYFRGIYQK